jgi:hypothetical protein
MCRDGRRRIVTALVIALLPFTAAADPRVPPRSAPVRALIPGDAYVAEIARQGAMARLRVPECRQILSDFRDDDGRPLVDNLAAFAVEPDAYLAMLPFLDGATRPLCQANQSQLLSAAGVPRVFVCKSFLKTVSEQRAMAEAYVIHEMLHTLGLGENPPSSREITRQVVRRCAP